MTPGQLTAFARECKLARHAPGDTHESAKRDVARLADLLIEAALQIDSVFDAIADGDGEHQTWLRITLRNHFNPPVAP